MKQATLHIDLDSVLYNFRHLKCFYKKKVIAVLKDDAYGLGLLKIYNAIKYEEDLVIAVSSLNEAKLLRDNNFLGPIIYLNVFDKEDVGFIKENNISVIIDSLDQLSLIKNSGIPIHLKINTGMNRLGLYKKDINKAIALVNDEKSYNLEGVMSHFADDDKHHEAYYLFEEYVKKIKKKNIMIHCFASGSLNSYFENISTHIRVGLKLFGIGERNSFLHNVVRLTCLPLSIKKIGKDERVGYDFSYMTKESGYLYILPFGYGKGFPRLNNLVAFCDNSYLRQAGKMSMDFSTFYFRKLLKTNDEIEIFGKKIPIESICKNNDVSAHELLVNLKVNKKYYETKI